MGRRTFLAGTGAVFLAAPLTAKAQQAGKMVRVGSLIVGPPQSPQELGRLGNRSSFIQSMRELGWVEGQNMFVERRFGESAEQLRTGAPLTWYSSRST